MSQTYSLEKEIIKIESNVVKYNTILYQLNETNKTTSVIGYKFEKGDLFIPLSVYYESQEYIITSISDRAF